jgi:hypothetical protein
MSRQTGNKAGSPTSSLFKTPQGGSGKAEIDKNAGAVSATGNTTKAEGPAQAPGTATKSIRQVYKKRSMTLTWAASWLLIQGWILRISWTCTCSRTRGQRHSRKLIPPLQMTPPQTSRQSKTVRARAHLLAVRWQHPLNQRSLSHKHEAVHQLQPSQLGGQADSLEDDWQLVNPHQDRGRYKRVKTKERKNAGQSAGAQAQTSSSGRILLKTPKAQSYSAIEVGRASGRARR